jgi:3-oxoacyl-[acyl-carrier-protein] synthase-3
MQRSVILGTGSYLPERIVTNEDLSKRLDTNDEWISGRTGIKQRHILADDQYTSDLAFEAAKKAIESSNIDKNDIDLIIVATTTPDNTFPATAAKVQALLDLSGQIAFDLQAVCSGFVYALSTADNFLRSGQAKTALVIGAEAMSRIVDWEDRNTCVLFGDGAGAVILQSKDDNERGIISSHLHSDGKYASILNTDGGAGSLSGHGKLQMQGKEVFKHATQKMASCVMEALQANNYTIDDVDWLVPHQANIRIIKAVGQKINIPENKVIITVQNHANTSSASIPLALDKSANKFKKGDLIVLEALGGGLSWGSCILKW